jgi:hypothetical protein
MRPWSDSDDSTLEIPSLVQECCPLGQLPQLSTFVLSAWRSKPATIWMLSGPLRVGPSAA